MEVKTLAVARLVMIMMTIATIIPMTAPMRIIIVKMMNRMVRVIPLLATAQTKIVLMSMMTTVAVALLLYSEAFPRSCVKLCKAAELARASDKGYMLCY